MKKINTLLLISALSIGISSASTGNESLYKKLKANYEESFSMSLSKNMIDFFDMDLDFNGKEKLVTGDFHEGKMMVLKDVSSAKSILDVFEAEKYEQIKDEDNKIESDQGEAYLYIMRNGKNISEAHFVVVGEEKVTIMTVLGDIKVKNK